MLRDALQERFYAEAFVALRRFAYLLRAFAYADAFDLGRIPYRDALSGYAVEDREVQLVVVCLKIHEKLVDLVHHLVYARVLLVYLVDEEDRVHALCERLAQHEPRLRHRSLARIHKKNDRVDGLHDALHLGAEIRVPRSVDYIDLVVLIHDGAVLGIDGDAALPFDRVGIHHAVHYLLVVPENMGLRKKRVHQGGLARVYMRYYCYVDYLLFLCHYPSMFSNVLMNDLKSLA